MYIIIADWNIQNIPTTKTANTPEAPERHLAHIHSTSCNKYVLPLFIDVAWLSVSDERRRRPIIATRPCCPRDHSTADQWKAQAQASLSNGEQHCGCQSFGMVWVHFKTFKWSLFCRWIELYWQLHANYMLISQFLHWNQFKCDIMHLCICVDCDWAYETVEQTLFIRNICNFCFGLTIAGINYSECIKLIKSIKQIWSGQK